MTALTQTGHGEAVTWEPTKPRLRPFRLLVSWAIAAATLYVAAILVPGVTLEQPGAAFVVAAVVAILNAIVPPVVAALRLPFMLALGFVIVLVVDALLLLLADELLPDFIRVDSFGDALLASLVMAAVSIVLQVITGTNDDDEYTVRVVKRVARRQGVEARTDTPGILFLEIDGLALPVLRQAMRDGQRAQHGALGGRGRVPARGVGAGPLLSDRRKPGGHPARLEREHPGVPVGREGDRAG